jgi:hypothetical protein
MATRTVRADQLTPGTLVLLPMGRTATVRSVQVGTRRGYYVSIRWADGYPASRVERPHKFLVDFPEPAEDEA